VDSEAQWRQRRAESVLGWLSARALALPSVEQASLLGFVSLSQSAERSFVLLLVTLSM